MLKRWFIRHLRAVRLGRIGTYLGTNSMGSDVLAMLFGGLQQAMIAAMLFVTMFVRRRGCLVGGTLGYFGGALDLVGQRLIEIWSVLPFLFIVMIISSLISPTLFRAGGHPRLVRLDGHHDLSPHGHLQGEGA